jgi:hypothetical protein
MTRFLFHCAALLLLATGCVRHHAGRAPVYHNPYHHPLVSPGAAFGALPPTVQNTIRAEAGGSEIENVFSGMGAGHPVYVIYFRNEKIFPPLYVGPDGSVLNPNLTVALPAPQPLRALNAGVAVRLLKPSDLPPKVAEAIKLNAPNASVDFILQEIRDDQLFYVVAFKDRPTKLHLREDGTLIEH